jgi:hypothetical protein
MEAERTDARETRYQELNEALEVNSVEELDGLNIQNQRLARVQEYEEAAVSRSDPFAAVIGMGSASFQRIFEHLGAAILDELDGRAHTFEELRELTPEIRLLVKLRDAIEKDFEVQAPDADQQAAALPRLRKSKGRDTKVATSKRDLLPKRWMGNS